MVCITSIRGGVAQWVARLIRYVEVVVWAPSKARCFLEQETLPLLLSTGWFQERFWAWVHNQTKINWGPYIRLTFKCQISPLVKYCQNQILISLINHHHHHHHCCHHHYHWGHQYHLHQHQHIVSTIISIYII